MVLYAYQSLVPIKDQVRWDLFLINNGFDVNQELLMYFLEISDSHFSYSIFLGGGGDSPSVAEANAAFRNLSMFVTYWNFTFPVKVNTQLISSPC